MEVSGQLHAPAALPPGKNLVTHWIGSCVGPSAGMDVKDKEELPCLYRDLQLGGVQAVP
jgi:hypothetical protein